MRLKLRFLWSVGVNSLKRNLLAGIIVVVPIAGTIFILHWLFFSIDGLLAPLVEAIFGRNIVGVGFIMMLIVVYLAGIIGANVIGKRIIRRSELFLAAVPMVRSIYNTFKQVLESVMLPTKGGFKEVVLVEFPRLGMRTVGFVTNRVKDNAGRDYVNVYIPTTPNPTSGYLEIIPADEVTPTGWSVEDAVKIVVSGGTISPPVI